MIESSLSASGRGRSSPARLRDSAGADALDPGGYQSMMLFFGITSAIGFVFALLLWTTAGRHRDEISRRTEMI